MGGDSQTSYSQKLEEGVWRNAHTKFVLTAENPAVEVWLPAQPAEWELCKLPIQWPPQSNHTSTAAQ